MDQKNPHSPTSHSFVIGPDGRQLTLADLPPTDTSRWVIRRKAEVVAAIDGGLITLEDACRRYRLTVEEFVSWETALHRYGLRGLRATRFQDYRAPRSWEKRPWEKQAWEKSAPEKREPQSPMGEWRGSEH